MRDHFLSSRAREALRLWRLCASQWRLSWEGRFGLDYTALATVAALPGVDVTLDEYTLRLIQELESDALEQDAKRRAAHAKASEKK